MPIFYECDRCAACCRWPGDVRLSEAEIARIAEFLDLTEFDFIQKYTRLKINRQGLSLIEKQNGECIFLEGNDCRIQSVKPQQCREFPNIWNFPDFQKVCRAKPLELPENDYHAKIFAATGREL